MAIYKIIKYRTSIECMKQPKSILFDLKNNFDWNGVIGDNVELLSTLGGALGPDSLRIYLIG